MNQYSVDKMNEFRRKDLEEAAHQSALVKEARSAGTGSGVAATPRHASAGRLAGFWARLAHRTAEEEMSTGERRPA